MPRKQSIPRYTLDDMTPHGFSIRYLKDEFEPAHDVSEPHRDDHYLFVFQESGNNQLVVDFNLIKAKGRKIFCVLPGQVHQVTRFETIDSWAIAVATGLVPEQVRNMLEQSMHPLQPATMSENWAVKLRTGLKLLQLLHEDPACAGDPFHILKSALESVLSMFAAIYREQSKQEPLKEGRTAELTRKFKVLLHMKYRSVKSPSAYAADLNVSPAYLNEAVRKTTGMPVSHWIKQRVILEARRMLYYTETTVKEIAFELGYEDHAYFTRLFSKATGVSPLTFRQTNRK